MHLPHSCLPPFFIFLTIPPETDRLPLHRTQYAFLLPESAPAFLVLDDGMGTVDFNSKIIKKLISLYRHLNLRIIICIQYLNSTIPPSIRNCITFAIWFQQSQKIAIKALHDSFGQAGFETLDAFRDFNFLLGKYEFVVHDPNDISGKRHLDYKLMKAPKVIEEFVVEY